MKDIILLKQGEVVLKGLNRRFFEQKLVTNIRKRLKPMGAFPGPMYAASVILTLPIIILFLCFSKYFKEGISFMLK